KAGALSALGGGFTLPHLLRAEEARRQPRQKARVKSVIALYLLGGAGTQDMWDLKPNAPAEIRGEFKPIASSVPGLQVCEHLPRLSRWMHRAALVRSVNHKAGCHNPLPSYSGYEATLSDITTTKDTYPPSMGAICEYLKARQGVHSPGDDFPAYVYLPCYLGWGTAIRYPGPYAGFLGKRYDPLFTECSPHVDHPPEKQFEPQPLRGEPRIPNGVLADGITLDRLNTRQSLARQFDDRLREIEGQPAFVAFDRYEQRALSLLTSKKVKAAFDLNKVDPRLRDRYGRTLFGSSALIARQLVEAGTRFVNVSWDTFWERLKVQYEGWDTHHRNFPIYRDYNLPYFDLTCSALLEDLDSRGLLDETLVIVLSEMGRTPKINPNGGRDHWTYCYTVFMAGGGLKGGAVYGASDAHAAYVKDKPVSTADICATVYECLGIDPTMPIRDYAGRPIPVAHGGKPIHEILA
ncbi:MAG: DUF1501 domain-containing protein, partial [Planctomycetes bacterium]|nr:DUF1501 domain-containing protein [Planctomycetota bacterium]